MLESFGESPKACVTNSSRPPEKLKGKENPDLPSVCSNYWPPNVAPGTSSFKLRDAFINETQIGTKVDVVTRDNDEASVLGFEITNDYLAASFDQNSPFVATSKCYTGEASTYSCRVEVTVPQALEIQASCVFTNVVLSETTKFFAISYSTGQTSYAGAKTFGNLTLGVSTADYFNVSMTASAGGTYKWCLVEGSYTVFLQGNEASTSVST